MGGRLGLDGWNIAGRGKGRVFDKPISLTGKKPSSDFRKTHRVWVPEPV